MICCIGLLIGYWVGNYFSGVWKLILPVAGLGLGLIADMKLMKCCHKRAGRKK